MDCCCDLCRFISIISTEEIKMIKVNSDSGIVTKKYIGGCVKDYYRSIHIRLPSVSVNGPIAIITL